MATHTNSGIDAVGAVDWGTHFCQFYETADDLIDTLVPYFKAGLDNGERCMWVAARPLRAADATDALRNAVPDLDRYLARQQIEIIDHDEWYLSQGGKAGADDVIAGWMRRKDEGLARGHTGFRLTGNTYFLEARDWDDFAEYERKVNGCFCNERVIALCSYCTLRCDAGGAMDVVQNHEFALARRRGAWTMIESASVGRVKGALHRANQELETRVELRTSELRSALAAKDTLLNEKDVLLKEKDVLLQEVHHRVKNNLQVIAAFLHLRAKRANDAASREELAETLRRIKAMSLVHEALYCSGADADAVDFGTYLRGLARDLVASFGMSERVTVEVACSAEPMDLNTAVPLGLAASEGIANALKHAFPSQRSGRLSISLHVASSSLRWELVVSDDGVGAASSALTGRRGAGLSLSQALARQLKGELAVHSGGEDSGTTWRLVFPGGPRLQHARVGRTAAEGRSERAAAVAAALTG